MLGPCHSGGPFGHPYLVLYCPFWLQNKHIYCFCNASSTGLLLLVHDLPLRDQVEEHHRDPQHGPAAPLHLHPQYMELQASWCSLCMCTHDGKHYPANTWQLLFTACCNNIFSYILIYNAEAMNLADDHRCNSSAMNLDDDQWCNGVVMKLVEKKPSAGSYIHKNRKCKTIYIEINQFHIINRLDFLCDQRWKTQSHSFQSNLKMDWWKTTRSELFLVMLAR